MAYLTVEMLAGVRSRRRRNQQFDDIDPKARGSVIKLVTHIYIGIIAYVGYNFLIARMDRVVFKMEAATVEFLDLLQEPLL